MGKLYFLRFHNRKEVLDRTIVDILTSNNARTSVWVPREKGKILQDIIGVNSVCQGQPIKLGNGFYERGFVDPKDEAILYLIDAERKIIGIMPNKINLFYDQDKVSGENRYIWDGTIQEILEEFIKKGYRTTNINF